MLDLDNTVLYRQGFFHGLRLYVGREDRSGTRTGTTDPCDGRGAVCATRALPAAHPLPRCAPLAPLFAAAAKILPGCRAALTRLRAEWELVAVTARWGGVPRCRRNTELWLEANGIAMPTYYAPRPIPSDAPRAAFKASVIAHLLEERGGGGASGDTVFGVGVGDRPSDMQAYVQNGLHALVITDALGEVR